MAAVTTVWIFWARGSIFFFLLAGSLAVSAHHLSAQQTQPAPNIAEISHLSTLLVTTTGRKSGKLRTKPIWFVYVNDRLYLQSGKNGKTDWYRNLQKTPELKLKIGELILRGVATFVEDEAETERVHSWFREKYTYARFAGLIGATIGHGKVVVVEKLAVSARE